MPITQLSPLGATIREHGVHFAVWAPNSRTARVRLLDPHGATLNEVALERGDDDVFIGRVDGIGAGADYLYVLDDGRALPDPVSRWQPHGVHGASRVVDPAAFAWTDRAWRGLPSMADYVIYELHVGTFSEVGTFEGAIPHLAELRELGVTAIELMPVAEFPGARNWGYDGVHMYAAQSSYGGPHGLHTLVDAAHTHGLAVVLDVVYNHLGPEGNYVDAFGPYFHGTYATPWGRAVNFDGERSAFVRRHVIENALYWITDCHVDALRLDAIHGIYDASPRHVLAELTDAVHERASELGRSVHLIAESDLNDPRVVTATTEGGLGFDAQWADELHHALHVALTGETRGYYEAFADAPVASTLRAPFFRAGRGYEPSRPPIEHGGAADLPRDRFVVSLQNHDQVGNRATGDRIASLATFEQQKLAAALVLLSGYVPMLFMGEEYGETNDFLYFVSHGDSALLEAVRHGRRAEFAGFGWGDAVPDPADVHTFRRSRLDRSRLTVAAPHGALWTLYRDVLSLRRREPALRPGACCVTVHEAPGGRAGALAFVPDGGDVRAVCVTFNLADASGRVALPRHGAHAWRSALSTDAAAYGGGGRLGHIDANADGYRAELPAHAVEVFTAGPRA